MDVRIPIGILFALIGAMLVGYGLFAPSPASLPSAHLNAEWGTVLLIFGLGMLALAQRFAARSRGKNS